MAKKTKKNIAKGKNKKKRAAAKAQAPETEVVVADQKEIEKAEKKEAEKKKKEAAAKKKKAQRKENPNLWDKTVNFIKGTWTELKKTQWLNATQLNKATGSVFGIVSVFTLITWLVDSGLGALTAFILGL